MTEPKHCPHCGAPISADAPGELCLRCLARVAAAGGEHPSTTLGPPPGSTTFSSPRSFGDYELLERIGRGGMGVVYRARQRSLNRLVAVKMILNADIVSPTVIARFHREAEAAASLDHPNIVSTHEFGEWEGQPFFSMRLIEGGNLSKAMPRVGLGALLDSPDKGTASKAARREALERVARLTATIARAVHHAHEQGVVHRDLKPTNILIDGQGRPHLTDFGIARLLTGVSGLTGPDELLGTPNYMAPEQAQGKPVTVAADVYSLGAILYELLTGRPPFRSDTPVETLRKVTQEDPTHPTLINGWADRDLATISLKCLEKEPARRYGSAEALAEDLERWLRHEPIHARRANLWARGLRWVRRNPAGAGLIVALALAVGLLVEVMRLSEQGHREREDLLLDRVWRGIAEMSDSSRDGEVTILSDALHLLRGVPPQPKAAAGGAVGLLFAVYTHEEPTNMLATMAPVLDRLEREISPQPGVPVRIDLRIYRHYEKAQQAIIKGDVDFMRLGSSSYVEAHDANPNISLLAEQNGPVHGYIFVRADSGITSLSGLNGKRVGFVDKHSTTGNFLAKLKLLLAGLHASDLADGGTNYVGSHEKVVAAVETRQIHAGAANASIVEKYLGKPGLKFIQLADTMETNGLPWVAGPKLDRHLADAIGKGLRSIKDKALLATLSNKTTGFVEGHDSDYDSLREQMRRSAEFDSPRP